MPLVAPVSDLFSAECRHKPNYRGQPVTPTQRLTLRASEIRQRLAELGGAAELTDENRSELDRLRIEYQDVERRSQALTIADDAPEPVETRSEDRDLRDLEVRSNVGEMLDAVLSHRAADGAIAELQQHHDLDGNQIPLALLSDELETRAVTPAPADVGQKQQPIIPYVFPQSAAAFLQIPQPTVAVGEAVYPVLTSALAVGTPAENAEQDETTGAFSCRHTQPVATSSGILLQPRRPGPICRDGFGPTAKPERRSRGRSG